MNTKIKLSSPLISIIIRTRNEERWLTHCLSAISTQSIKDFEIILVDNNSDDNFSYARVKILLEYECSQILFTSV